MSALYLGDSLYQKGPSEVHGDYVSFEGDSWFKIGNYDKMEPFFMSIVSASNFWLFASSNGGLTCGRISAAHPIFPYYTVDKINDYNASTGPKTAMLVEKDGKVLLWEPFVTHPSVYKTCRNLYKNMLGNMLCYEESNEDLGLNFSYTWATADGFGIVRKCKLVNTGSKPVKVRVLDGLQNIVAANTNGWLQDHMSNLMDAYKWNEVAGEQVGLFCMFAQLSDRAEPLESLKATTVWHTGLPDAQILVSSIQLPAFLRGEGITAEHLVRGKRAAFFVHATVELPPAGEQRWLLVAEVDQTHGGISRLQQMLAQDRAAVASRVNDDIAAGSLALKQVMGAADGFQCLGDPATSTHHYANVMFNSMRGGVFDKGYDIDSADLKTFIGRRNTHKASEHSAWLAAMPKTANYLDVVAQAKATGDADLIRLCYEYIPITWGRRHGDPSRPWNQFNIVLRDDDGNRLLNYQGNWRDIFQNWEALTFSFPFYYESIIAKFVNASTPDGYNPYVVTKDEGVNWECAEHDKPEANIGYWGDHQLIYLLKLLEWCTKFQPGRLEKDCDKDLFSYANVPYAIRPYAKIVEDAKDTIIFDWDKHNHILKLKETMGVDAKLVLKKDGSVLHVNLGEKLLVPLLAKASNFVLEGGIWLNTQRPEWNDANNAIVGFGLSMVTVYYMRRYICFLQKMFAALPGKTLSISEEVATWLAGLEQVYTAHLPALASPPLSPATRRAVLDGLGEVASQYREGIYKDGFSGQKKDLDLDAVTGFLATLLRFVEASIEANRRPDGLFHAYNLLVLGKGTAEISYLYEMLEGQVSALSSGHITGDAAVGVFKSLYASPMYRADQQAFMLYPDRNLKGFMDRNLIPASKKDSPAVKHCLSRGLKAILAEDAAGNLRWCAEFGNAKHLKAALEKSADPDVKGFAEDLLALFEEVFVHRAFTGRSGTMFGFEGLGCIYWHMHSKVLTAALELVEDAIDKESPATSELVKYYYAVRAGIGFNKSPALYGAFPSDPYSHTPLQAGAQQPGMTGQVKEEVLTRFGELGLRIVDGTIRIQPKLLRRIEFLSKPQTFEFVATDGTLVNLPLEAGQLGFTYCQCPFVYTKGTAFKVTVRQGGQEVAVAGNALPAELAAEIFRRTGTVERVEVVVPDADLLDL